MSVVAARQVSAAVPLPPDVLAISRSLAQERLENPEYFTQHANSLLAECSAGALGTGSLLWRSVSNIDRLGDRPRGLDQIAEGFLVASCFNTGSVRATSEGRHIRVESRLVMVTGVQFASQILVSARIDDDLNPSMLLLPRRAIVETVRPGLRGLAIADNALVRLNTVVTPLDALVGRRGHGRDIVEAPYDRGLTFGAVALGGLRHAVALLPDVDNLEVAVARGRITADLLAAESLVAACTRRPAGAALLSRAAKLFATEAGVRAAAEIVRLSGASGYAQAHPGAVLQADMEGLTFQAPTNRGSLERLARMGSRS